MDNFEIHQQIMLEVVNQLIEKLVEIGGEEGPYIIRSEDFLDILLNYNSSWGEFSEVSEGKIKETAKELEESSSFRKGLLRTLFYQVDWALKEKHECLNGLVINPDNIIWID